MGDLGGVRRRIRRPRGRSKYYVLTLVFHDQSDSLEEHLARHAKGLRKRGLADTPFHAGPLMHGHGAFENLDLKTRKAYFQLFFIDAQHLPVVYHSLVYRRSEFDGNDALVAKMRRDIASLLRDRLSFFQTFDRVKIYYDDGQTIVAHALYSAFEQALAKSSVLHRTYHASDFMLTQAADLLCALELAAVKFANKEATSTDERMFGSSGTFRKNYLRPLRRKRLAR